MRRRRIYSEFLPPEELGSSATIDLLHRFGLEPIVALPPQLETEQMARALARISQRGIRLGVWPLLEDEEGYWPSEHNARAFCQRVLAVQEFLSGVRITTIAIDLEPPLSVVKDLINGSIQKRRAVLENGLLRLRDAERRRVVDQFRVLEQTLRAQQIETIATLIPPVVMDLSSGSHLFQAIFGTPAVEPGWAVLSPMMYTSLLAPLLPSKSQNSARALLYEAGRILKGSLGDQASLSLGCVTSGKLGDEPAFADPTDLAKDVGAAIAAGVDDLALFSLDGVLERGPPESWLTPFICAPSDPVPPHVRAPVSGIVRLASRMQRLFVRRPV